MSKPLILVVEDDPHQAMVISDELRDEGYEVHTVHTGQEAITFVQERRPNVVVLDIHMPEMDGIEVLHRMLDIDRHLPVILHTAYPSYQDDLRTWSAVRYVVKTSDMRSLKEAVAQVLLGGK